MNILMALSQLEVTGNYKRLDKNIVDRYSKEIRYYRGIINDLKD